LARAGCVGTDSAAGGGTTVTSGLGASAEGIGVRPFLDAAAAALDVSRTVDGLEATPLVGAFLPLAPRPAITQVASVRAVSAMQVTERAHSGRVISGRRPS